MTDRAFLCRMKALYEKEGGLIVRLLDRKQQIRTWIWEQEEGKDSIVGPDDQRMKEEICDLAKEAWARGTALRRRVSGEMLFLETVGKEDRMVICGAGYVGSALAKLSVFAGIHTILLEDRKDFADRAKETGAQEIICRPFDKAIRDLTEEANTAYVVMTRGHAYDEKCLLEIAKKESYYVGMMGSKTRSAMMREELRLAGVSAEWINRLHAPIGLSIGAQTPEEIAVAVLAQILSERSRVGNPLRAGYEVFRQALTCLKEGERFVLATILERQGSAPRKEGTHFIVGESGQCFGTIGGGKLEANIVQAAMEMMTHGERIRIESSDLNKRDAAEEGLVCGGQVRVLMEAGVNRQ